MFRSAVRYLKFKPEDGLHVVARGRLGVYEPKGEYQLLCEHMQPHGLGALQLAFEQLKKKLQAEGLFDQARKRPLPGAARARSASSPRSTARRCATSSRCCARRHPERAPRDPAGARAGRERGRGDRARRCARSRGSPASTSIIVARGGGSTEDLWAFNEEPVARAIVACPVPVDRRGRPRGGLHDCRLRRRPARADAVGGGRARGRGEGRVLRTASTGCRAGCEAAARGGIERRRAARARADQPPRPRRLAGARRHARPPRRRADASAAPRADAQAAAAASAALQALRRRLEARDLARRFAVDSRPPARRPTRRLARGDHAPHRSRPARASARWPAGSTRSARSPSSAAATPSAGTRTARRSSATPRPSRPATASRSRSRTARSAATCARSERDVNRDAVNPEP